MTLVNGYLSGVVSAAGALGGGYLSDRIGRRPSYLLCGGLTAAVALAMMLAPLTATTYAVGVTVYLFISGLCYASFSAVVLESIGTSSSASASTQYTLFSAAGNAAILYTGWIDTRFHRRYGPAGLLGVDASLNVLGIALLALLMRRRRV